MPILSFLFTPPLATGIPAPDFSLPDHRGGHFRLSEHLGKHNVVLIFYPGDDTTTCTRQLCEMRDRWPSLQDRATVVFGVNPQSAEKHHRFAEKYNLPFPLLIDKGQHVAKLYNASGLVVRRTVYLIGKSGQIRFAQRGRPSAQTVLQAAE